MSPEKKRPKKLIVGVTGASGAMLGQRLVRAVLDGGHEVHLIMSESAREVFAQELNIADPIKHFGRTKHLTVYEPGDMSARVSSGSARFDAMVIVPCSLSSVAAIAHGITMNLIHRAASVCIKEKRPLLLVPRESPLSPIHLRNLLVLSEIGVHILPATTAFYHRPRTVEDMADFTVARALDLLGIENALIKRWKQPPGE